MGEHLSSFALDEAVAGDALSAEAAAHLASCPACTAQVEALRAEQADFLQQPRAAKQVQALTAAAGAAAAHAPKRRWPLAVAVGLAAALTAGVVVPMLRAPATQDTRLKASTSVALQDATGATVTRAKVGDTLTLVVGAAGLRYGAVFTVDAAGAVERLWPGADGALGEVPPGAAAPLLSLTVTPGDVAVHAIFSNRAGRLDAVQAHLRAAVEQARQDNAPPTFAALPDGAFESQARVQLTVSP